MKIAFVSQPTDGVLPPLQNSIGIWLYQMACVLAPSHHVTVFTRRDILQADVQRIDGVTYRGISRMWDEKLLRRPRLFGKRRPGRPLFTSWLYYFNYALRIALQLAYGQFDVIMVTNHTQFLPLIRYCCPRAVLILRMTCEWLTQLDRRMILRRLRHVDYITGCSDYITNQIRQSFPTYATRCGTVACGVDTQWFRPRKEQPHERLKLLFLGRLSPEKGVHVLLEAFGKVAKRLPQADLELVGPASQLPADFIARLTPNKNGDHMLRFYKGTRNDYYNQLQKQVAELQIADRISFKGMVAYKDVLKHFEQADVLINPSFSESLGRSLIEAMACNVPVVATRVGGMQEVVDNGRCGILTEAGDADALAEAIVTVATQQKDAHPLVDAGRRRVEETYAWEKVAERFNALLADLIKRKRS